MPSSRRRALWRVLPNYLFVLPYFIIFIIFTVGPLGYTGYMSLYNRSLFDNNPPFVGLQNYTNLWSDSLWLTVLQNTIEFVVITVIGVTVVALGLALLIRSIRWGQTLLRTILFAPAVLSAAIVVIIFNWMFAEDQGAYNYLLSLVGINKIPWTSDPAWVIPSLAICTTWWVYGFPMIVFLAGLLNISPSLYEAAAIDGAGALARFFTITLPLLRPTILFVMVTQVIAQFQLFAQPAFITQGGPGDASRVILMYLYDTVWRHFKYGYGAAMAITLALIMAVVTAIQFVFLGRNVTGE
jgi:multiple sugar transport system permease protein